MSTDYTGAESVPAALVFPSRGLARNLNCATAMCGNVTLLGRLEHCEVSALPERAGVVLEAMLRISQMRGAQSGGGALQFRSGKQAHHELYKCVNSKRGDLAARLGNGLRRNAHGRPAFGGTFLAQSHVRYATSGESSAHEAHPFYYVEPKQRGSRRILRWIGGRSSVSEQPVYTTLTHNGDMEGLRWRGTWLPYPELGDFLERVLGAPNRWSGDSPLLAGAVELLLCRGMWFESLRLAFHLTVAPEPPDLAALPASLVGEQRRKAARELLASYPAPSASTLEAWAKLAEKAWRGRSDTPTTKSLSFRELLEARLLQCFEREAFPELPIARLAEFVRATVEAFLDNDLYVAVRKLEAIVQGTFGCVVTSTLEPGCAVAFSRGQPLSLGFHARDALVGIVSERAALKVRGAGDQPVFEERLDLDLCRGEIARVEIDAHHPIRLTVFNVAEGREWVGPELVAAGRLIALRHNPYVTPLPAEIGDRTRADLGVVAGLVEGIRRDWQDPKSRNARTASQFAQALLDNPQPRLLLLGITNDLWLSQQFVRTLKSIFPGIVAEARSSNEILQEVGQSGFHESTIVLAVSQSGQDFPTLGALLSLQQRAGSSGARRFFVLSGEADTLMGEAVGQRFDRDARDACRIFTTGSGFRCSEAATATVNATHHTLVELLLFLAGRALDQQAFPQPPHAFRLSRDEVAVLRRRRDFTVDQQVPHIAGAIGTGPASDLRRELARGARRWTWHVLEAAVAFALVVLVLQLNFQLGFGLEPARLIAMVPRNGSFADWPWRALDVAATQANIAFYALLGPLLVWGLRRVQGRPGLHRQGARELLIGDTGYVHRVIWLLARRLFSLSYGFASIKAYSADNQDELVLTHEPVRGTLALFGIPGAGLDHLAVRQAAATMTARQFGSSRSFGGAGAEVVTVGHVSGKPKGAHTHLALPHPELGPTTARVQAVLEDLFDSWERMLAMQVFLCTLAEGVSKFWPLRYDASRTKDQVFAPTTAAPVSAAVLYQLLSQNREQLAGGLPITLPNGVTWSSTANPAGARTLIWGTKDDEQPPSSAAA
jgi:hypothetical protein